MTGPDLLDSLHQLKVQVYKGQPAPYQHVVLLWAIDRAHTGKPRMSRFSEVKDELGRALAPFALAKTPPNPAACEENGAPEVLAPDDATERAVFTGARRSVPRSRQWAAGRSRT
ncbi:hypothetical protein [Prescottella equi]|uniref:hypothetical protein n=1 Tax=Rhodococcus hoagii TaxID=43767 RepID=UPI0007CD6B40|nr:hypothetical protein [Prescottella equi]